MNTLRKISITFLLGASLSAHSTGFTLGDKELWKEICDGNYVNHSAEQAKNICHTALMFYWAGYSHAQSESNLELTLCPKTLGQSITKDFVNFLKSTEHEEKTDFVFLANEFFKGQGNCN